jgi:transcription elongation factor Elf1
MVSYEAEEVSSINPATTGVLEAEAVRGLERYFVCPFCGQEGTELSGRDSINTWCVRCGKCFVAEWRERCV